MRKLLAGIECAVESLIRNTHLVSGFLQTAKAGQKSFSQLATECVVRHLVVIGQ